MIIGLSGYAGSGKDTVASVLIEQHGFTRLAFADPIREFLLLINPILSDGHRVNELVTMIGWDNAKSKSEVRRLLQDIGVGCRQMFGENFWIKQLQKKLETTHSNVVITDVRFLNEANWIKETDGQVWRVLRANVRPINEHISEVDLDNYKFDHIIVNDAGINDIKQTLQLLLPHANQTH